MSSNLLFYDTDDERDQFDIDDRQIEIFQRDFLSASVESSEDDDEGIIDGTKIPSSTKQKTRARHSFLDISTLSSTSNHQSIDDDDDDLQANPFDIISKSIDIDHSKPVKKKKSLGVPKTRVLLDTTDIYDQEDSRDSIGKNEETDQEQSNKKTKVRKPKKSDVLETERKMQQLSRSEQLVLPTFIPKPLETWHALERRSRQELMNEIRAQNPSFTPQDPELPEIPVVDVESMAAATLADLTKLIEDKPSTSTNTLNKLSRFLNPEILKKKPTISSSVQQSETMIDLNDNRKIPTIKSNIQISLDCIKSPSSSRKLFEMQKQLGLRMREKRAAMLAENNINILSKEEEEEEEDDDDEVEEVDEDSMDTTEESNDDQSEMISNVEQEDENLPMDDEEVKEFLSDEEEEEIEEEKENTNPKKDSDRPSLKTMLTRLESASEPAQVQPSEPIGQTEWFNSARPAQFDSDLEMLCSGAFNEENIVPLSQNYTHPQPMAFSPLPPTQIEEEDEPITDVRRTKVRQLIDDDDEDEENGSIEEEEGEGEEGDDDNEELVDYKKQLFEMEAEESGSEIDEKDREKDDESDSDENEEPDEELQKFIDTAAIEIDDDEVDNIAKVHLKIKAKEDEQQLKLLKEQYLDFDGDDDGRRIKISKGRMDDEDEEDDPDYNSEIEEEEEDDEEEEDPMNLKDRMSELERQRSIQDTQAEELHLNEDLDNIGQHSSMFQKGLALKQKKIQSTTTSHAESSSQITTDSNTKKTRSVTLSSVLLAKRFSSTLLAPVNRNPVSVPLTTETTMATKKQHNPRRHVFAATATNENQNPVQPEKRANSADKSPKTNIKRFKQTTTSSIISTESSSSVFSALAQSHLKP